MTQQMVLPPACIGILGGGQLGMMLAIVAKQMGYKVAILEADPHCPASRIADYHLQGAYNDEEALAELAKISQVITTEFENVPASAVKYLAQRVAVYPAADALLIAQNRIQEKTFFRQQGLATADFAAVNSLDDCQNIQNYIFPAILKTATLGYDGKGQKKVKNLRELSSAYLELNHPACILEKMIDLAQEVSIIVARNCHGSQIFPLLENQHRNGILDTSYIPARVAISLAKEAELAALKIAEGLNYTGILTVEFFISQHKQLLINEIAPRPHNSGHITIEACETSQFEQQLRAICGLPLGATTLKAKGAMLNLLGDLWLSKDQLLEKILTTPMAKYHCYGKKEAKPGRKMGHLSLTGPEHNLLAAQIKSLKSELGIEG